MKTVVLAEKPSVAREIATILNAYEKKEGFIEEAVQKVLGNPFFVGFL